MDAAAARAAPGVVAVVTTLEIEPLGVWDYNVARLFGGNVVEHYHQAIAVVVAETFEQARAAAALIGVTYEEDEADFDLDAAFERLEGTGEPSTNVGDFDAAFASAAVTLDEMYRTPSQSHAMMDPCLDRRLVRRWPDDGLDIEPDDRMEPPVPGHDLRRRSRHHSRRKPVHRWRLRRQALAARRCGACRAGLARSRSSGQAGAAAALHD
jgi:hypothetical protein